jgi:hypothetical protein
VSDHHSSCSYFSPKLCIQEAEDKGRGMFAAQDIAKGELVLIMGGNIYAYEQLESLDPVVRTYSIQVEENAYIAPHQRYERSYLINHSCDPNIGVLGQITFVALRDIRAGEELGYDYAMTDGSAYDEFECLCGSPNCRGIVRGSDWQRPELWERYGQHFSPYLLRRIAKLKLEGLGVKTNGTEALLHHG